MGSPSPRILYPLVFGSGAILMALEMLGSRLLAPHFGSSVYVWGSLITVFMIALSGGYYVGGVVADRLPLQSTLTTLLMAAGALTAMVPMMADPVARALSPWGPRGGALTAALIIFLLPTIIMGMVSPVAVRLAVADLAGVGKTAGRINAVSTAGSIIGTLGTTFLLVPLTGTKLLVTGLAACLFLLGAVSAFADRHVRQAIVGVLVAAALLFVGPSSVLRDQVEYVAGLGLLRTVYATESAYHNIRVMDGPDARYLRFDDSWQTGMDRKDPFKSTFSYPDYFHIAKAVNPAMRNVLMIGLGGGQAPKKFWKDYPDVSIDAVEIDPTVVSVARQYFALPDDPRLNLFTQDGRRYVDTTNKRYDLILVDAYYAHSVPFHLTTREFMRGLQSRLNPGGYVAFNIIGALEGPKSEFFRSFFKTAAGVFSSQYPVAVDWQQYPGAAQQRNLILFAGVGTPLRIDEFKRTAIANAAKTSIPNLPQLLSGLYAEPIRTDDVPVLTDDHAPVDDLLKVLD